MQEAVYRIGEDYKCRSICPVKYNTEVNQFLIGTQSLKAINKVILLSYDDDRTAVDQTAVYEHPSEIWIINTNHLHPHKAAIINGNNELELVQFSESNLEVLHEVKMNSRINSLNWTDNGAIISTSSSMISYDLSSFSTSFSYDIPSITTTRNDPHHSSLFAIATYPACLHIYDNREKNIKYYIPNAHGDKILDIDFNPNNPYHLATCSKDTTVRLWDMRKQDSCLKILQEHSHWVWQVKFNNYHDQLLLTSSSDNTVGLHRIVSGSSAPVDESFFERESDEMLSKIEEFDDSVYSVCWSAAEAWFFASASYDGKICVNAVPNEEKYKILL